jgi:hypothetical protein
LALIILSLVLAYLQSSSYPPESIIHIIEASETAEERAHERIESGTIQNGFSPVRPEQCKQVTKQSEKIAINYHHKV